MAYRLTQLGMQVTMLDGRKIGAGSTAANTAILSYEADVNLGELIEKIGRVLKLTQALVRRAMKRGLKVFVQTKVVSYAREGRESILTTEDGFEVRARHVVFATGYETQQFLGQKGVKLKSSYTIASKPMRIPTGRKFPVIWETARPYLYVRATTDSRMIVGGEDVDFVDEKRRDRLLPAKTKALEKKIRKLMPGIRWKLAAAWTGTFAETKDGLPYIGQNEKFPGAHFALGYGGNGITFAAIASMIVPDLIRGQKNHDARIFRFERRLK